MKVHQLKYVPQSCIDMQYAQLSHEDVARIPKQVDEVYYLKLEGVAHTGHLQSAVQLIMRKGKGYFRHSQTSLNGRKNLSNFELKGKGKSLKELWKKLQPELQDDLSLLFAAADEGAKIR